MGGGYYERDVPLVQERITRQSFARTVAMEHARPDERVCHTDLNIFRARGGAVRECRDSDEHPDTTPIVIAIDVTQSRGDDTLAIFDRLPRFIGDLRDMGWVPHPVISFAAIGDATDGDRAPLQVSQFESDSRLDRILKDYLWIEGGGGGSGQESYQLAAYYYAKHSQLDCVKRGTKGLFFFFGDEGFYPTISKAEVERIIGDKLPADMTAKEAFTELQKLYDVYFIFPRKTMEERVKDIDEEIRQRIVRAHGMVDNLDLRFSLIWHNRNDLDLHVITPTGHEIYYGYKVAPCGGNLDVDMNVDGKTTKPVENVRWERGKARQGTYKVFVRNYAFHERDYSETPFAVEIEINGKVQRFEGKTAAHATGSQSDVQVGEFVYDPHERPADRQKQDLRAAYADANVVRQWARVIPGERILKMADPNACVDVMLGVIAMERAELTWDEYARYLVKKEQTPKRIAEVKETLADLMEYIGSPMVNLGPREAKRSGMNRRTGTKRL